MSTAKMRTIACLSVTLVCAGAAAEKRVMTNPAFGCPSAYETSHVLQMRREGLGVDGHVTEEVDRASRAYMAEHKCRFLKKGDFVEFDWSNVQKLDPETLGHAVCIRMRNSDECSYTPKNFAEARSSSVQEEASKESPAAINPAPPSALAPLGASTAPPQVETPANDPRAARISSPALKTKTMRHSSRIELSPL